MRRVAIIAAALALALPAGAAAHPADNLTNREAKREAGYAVRKFDPDAVPGSGAFTIFRRRYHNRARVLVVYERYGSSCAWYARVRVQETEVSWRTLILDDGRWEC
jgi:hypothetical protein